MKKTVTTLLLLVASAAAAAAQTSGDAAREAVSSLPESQAVMYVNARRITNEALPRVIPQATLDQAFAEARKVSVEVRSIEHIILGVRYGEALATNSVPDFGLAVRGGFNADAILSVLRMAQAAQYRPEKHGGRDVDVYKIDFGGKKDEGKDAAAATPDTQPSPQPTPPFKLPSEFAIVALGADELLLGTPAYVRAAIDARSSAGPRIRADLVDLAMRNTDALVSIAGDLPPGLSKFLDAAGSATGQQSAVAGIMNEELKRILDSLRQLQVSVNMTPAEFGVQTILRTERPEDARALSGLVDFGVAALEQEMRKSLSTAKTAKARADAQKALGVLKALSNTARENELTLSLSVPQSTVAEFVRQQQTAQKPAAKPAPRRATPRRRRGTARRRT